LQLILAFGVLGLSAYFRAVYRLDIEYYVTVYSSSLSYLVALGAITICWVFISFVLYCINKLLPLVVIIVDAIMLVTWIAAVARYLVLAADTLVHSCQVYSYYYDYDYDYDWYDSDYDYGYGYDYDYNALGSIQCRLWKALFGLMVIELVTFISTIVLGSVAFWKLRKGPRVTGAGAQYVFPSGKAGAPNVQAPQQFVLYNPAAPQVFVPYPHPHPQQPMEPPQAAYNPPSVRYSSPPPPQQYYVGTRYQSPPLEQDRPPSSTYQYPPGLQQQP